MSKQYCPEEGPCYTEPEYAEFLLKQAVMVLNSIPNKRFAGNEGDFETTYELASAIDKFLKTYENGK